MSTQYEIDENEFVEDVEPLFEGMTQGRGMTFISREAMIEYFDDSIKNMKILKKIIEAWPLPQTPGIEKTHLHNKKDWLPGIQQLLVANGNSFFDSYSFGKWLKEANAPENFIEYLESQVKKYDDCPKNEYGVCIET